MLATREDQFGTYMQDLRKPGHDTSAKASERETKRESVRVDELSSELTS